MKKKNLEISIRDFLRNYKKLINKKRTIIVLNRGTPEGVFIPYEKWEGKEEKRKIDWDELIEKCSFSGPPDLSQKIDEIVYGSSNPYRNDNP